MKYSKLFFLLVSLVHFMLGGTTGKLTGIVKDENTNEPLIGCNIMIDGTSLGLSLIHI